MRATVRWLIRKGLERVIGVFGYQLINPAHRYGIDPIADVKRLSGLWRVEIGMIFDVGANVGKTTLAFRRAWPGSKIFAFEPNAAVAEQLRAAVVPLGDVAVETVALGRQSGSSAFYTYGAATALGSLNVAAPYVERHGMKGETIDVEVDTLDAFCGARSIDRVNLLKIDTEGSDYDVLRGAAHLLAERRIDFIYCEFNALDGDPERLGSLLPIARLLSENGYNFIASYNDYIIAEGPFFSVSNALFAAPRPEEDGGDPG